MTAQEPTPQLAAIHYERGYDIDRLLLDQPSGRSRGGLAARPVGAALTADHQVLAWRPRQTSNWR